MSIFLAQIVRII